MLSDFFAMGGYGAYVWSAYAICGMVMIANVVLPLLKEKQTLRDLNKRIDTNKK